MGVSEVVLAGYGGQITLPGKGLPSQLWLGGDRFTSQPYAWYNYSIISVIILGLL